MSSTINGWFFCVLSLYERHALLASSTLTIPEHYVFVFPLYSRVAAFISRTCQVCSLCDCQIRGNWKVIVAEARQAAAWSKRVFKCRIETGELFQWRTQLFSFSSRPRLHELHDRNQLLFFPLLVWVLCKLQLLVFLRGNVYQLTVRGRLFFVQVGAASLTRSLHEIALQESVRYAPGDPIEEWLNNLLCLDCGSSPFSRISIGLPPPDSCELYPFSEKIL